MSRRLPWFPLLVADFLADTASLSPAALSILVRGMALLWKEAPGETLDVTLVKLRALARLETRSFDRALRELDGCPLLAVSVAADGRVTLSSRYLAEVASTREKEADRKNSSRARPADVRPTSGESPGQIQSREEERRAEQSGPAPVRPIGPAGGTSSERRFGAGNGRWPKDRVPAGCGPLEPRRRPTNGSAMFGKEAGPFGGYLRISEGVVQQVDFDDPAGTGHRVVFSANEKELRQLGIAGGAS